ncbi:MAG TPA: restriction endonuclease [Pyrinomonadaceae bacterium]|nr:restriction endonuclease [Pyrinomonadaceae bacterium]
MSNSKQQTILDWFYRAQPRTGLIDFGDLLASAASEALGLSGMENAAYVASNSSRIWSALQLEQDLREREGVNPILEMIDVVRKCRWHSILLGVAPPAEMRRRLRLRSRPAMIERIDNLTWRQYEALGCVVSQLCGASQVHLTPPGNECGIDFFATVTVNGNNHVFSGSRTPLRIVAQCKKYESRVDVEKIKSFNDTLGDLRKKEPKVTALTPAWFQLTRGPIVGWVIAHKGFKSGAKTRAHNHGILLSDTIDLAEIAALSRDLPESMTTNERADELIKRIQGLLT